MPGGIQLGSELLGFSFLDHDQDIVCMACNLFSEPLVSFAVNKLLVLPFFLLQSPNCCFQTSGTYQLTDTIQHRINAFLANGVVATGIVIGCIFLSSDQLFRMKKFPEGASPYFIWRRKRNCENMLQYQQILVVVGINACSQSQEVMMPKNRWWWRREMSPEHFFIVAFNWFMVHLQSGHLSSHELVSDKYTLHPQVPRKKVWRSSGVPIFRHSSIIGEKLSGSHFESKLKKSRIWMAKMSW